MSESSYVEAAPLPNAQTLVHELDQLFGSIPTTSANVEHRAAAIRATCAALAGLGVDAESLVRYGMPGRASLGILLAVISPDDAELSKQIDLAKWRQILEAKEPGSDGAVDTVSVARVPHRLMMWVQNAPFEELLTFGPPSPEHFSQYLLATPTSVEISSAYTWLWERATTETLGQWATQSLHLEYRWQNKNQLLLFSEESLNWDGPDSALLNEEIAHRAVEPSPDEGIEADRLFWELQAQAVEFLVKEKFIEAAALFEFHNRLHPDDARSINNLGFCRLPTDPESALHNLRRAEISGYSPVAMNVYNQCCCLHALNRSGEALDRAESYWQRQREADGTRGFVWVNSMDDWSLTPDADPERALVVLAETIAVELGRTDRAKKWIERAELLSRSETDS